MSTKSDRNVKRFVRGVFSLKEIGLVVLVVLFTRTALAEQFYVPSGSMEPTLAIGDRLLVPKFSYGYSRYSLPDIFGMSEFLPSSTNRFLEQLPARGDVVVFRLPRDPSQTYVKRVIGLPGDRIQMRSGRLWINRTELALKPDGTGKVENEDGSLVEVPKFSETMPDGREHPIFKVRWGGDLGNTSEFVVPPGDIFVMGDNRDNSLDSRVAAEDGGVGYVPLENLIGRVDMVVMSWDMGGRNRSEGIRFSRFFSFIN